MGFVFRCGVPMSLGSIGDFVLVPVPRGKVFIGVYRVFALLFCIYRRVSPVPLRRVYNTCFFFFGSVVLVDNLVSVGTG